MEKIKFNQTTEEITITIQKKENYSLDELKQKTINKLYNSKILDSNDINLLKLILEYEKD